MPDTLPSDPFDDRDLNETWVERAETFSREMIVPTTTHPVRSAVLLLVAGAAAACAPWPIAIVGVAAVVLLVFDKRR